MQRILRILQYEKASKFENIQANLVEFRGEKVLFLCNNCYNSVLLQYNTIEQKMDLLVYVIENSTNVALMW